MYPRGTPDLGWNDLLFGLAACLLPDDPQRAQAAAEAAFGPLSLACLSVRSGFDLTLRALALPRGSEVLVSAISIPDMTTILAAHGLTAVPIDLDMTRLAPDPAAVAAAITPRTRAILIAHLFGARMPLDDLAALAQQHRLLLLEDAAQAYSHDDYRGHAASDVAMFSFGPIKTATALGGGLLRFRDRGVWVKVQLLQQAYPRQQRRAYALRILRFIGLKALARPALLGPFAAFCRLRGLDMDALLSAAVRGFPGDDLFAKIRKQPAVPLLRLLARRLRRPDRAAIGRRVAYTNTVLAQVPAALQLGAQAEAHTHWVTALRSRDPATLTALLRAHGFDASRSASTMRVVAAAEGAPAASEAQRALDQLVYLPSAATVPAAAAAQLAAILAEHAREMD